MNAVIILAGGKGERTGLNYPKQFYEINNQTILEMTINKFINNNLLHQILIVTNADYEKKTRNIINKFKNKSIDLIVGGKTRFESSYKGLKHFEKKNIDIVLIHDAARPFIDKDLIDKLIYVSKEKGCCIPVIEEKNTISIMKKCIIKKILNKSEVFIHQTPQAFIYKDILKAYEKSLDKSYHFTDDASVYNLFNEINIIYGDSFNFKITSEMDLQFAEFIIKSKKGGY